MAESPKADARAVADGAAAEARDFADQFLDGTINDAQLVLDIRRLAKGSLLAGAAAAKGGLDKLTPADLGSLGALSRDLYASLDDALRRFHSGEITGPQLAAWAAQLTKGAAAAFEEATRRAAIRAGAHRERRILSSVNPCPGCIEEADKGWSEPGSLLPIGACDCGFNCECVYELI